MNTEDRAERPRKDWSRVWFAVFFLCLALSLAFAHLPVVVMVLRVIAMTCGMFAAALAWRAGGRGRALLLAVLTIGTLTFLPAPPVPSPEERRSAQWFFIILGTVVLAVSLVQAFRDEGRKAASGGQGSTGS